MNVFRTPFARNAIVWLVSVCWSTNSFATPQDDLSFPLATPESQGISEAMVRRVADEVHAYVENGTIIGGELIVIKNRRTILHEVFGDRDREDKQPMEPNTIFNIRSMTKPLTGVAVQILADEGKLKLDEPASKYLPAFDNDPSRGITIEQLLQHRSGLPLTILTARLDQFSDLQNQAEAIGEKGPDFRPGEKFWYSDAGSDAAAAIVEQLSGMTIDRFVAQRILEPLEMNDSFYLNAADPASATDPRKNRVASLYIGNTGKWMKFWSPSREPLYPFAWGSQSLYSTPADYARFLALWMDEGVADDKQLLSKEAVARILTPVSPMKQLGGDNPYPCGFFGLKAHYGQMSMLYAAGESPRATDVVAFGHGGSDGTGAWAFPAEDLIVCYFTQSRGQLSTIRLETTIQDALLYRADETAVPAGIRPLIGTYTATFGPFQDAAFHVVFRCGKLAMDIPGELMYELREPDSEGRWALVANESNYLTFKKDDGGNVLAMILHRPKVAIEMPRVNPTPQSQTEK
ncbi:MAG: beta-lactamase family protein [Planctomycetaceae bacterium]|nr:beta-lactamase family protein [Planctomycetaceae bacterium]